MPFEKVNYYTEPLDERKLRELLKKMRLAPSDILRTSEPIYKELGLGTGEFSDDEIISLMLKHPDLIQRPIVEREERRLRSPHPARATGGAEGSPRGAAGASA